ESALGRPGARRGRRTGAVGGVAAVGHPAAVAARAHVRPCAAGTARSRRAHRCGIRRVLLAAALRQAPLGGGPGAVQRRPRQRPGPRQQRGACGEPRREREVRDGADAVRPPPRRARDARRGCLGRRRARGLSGVLPLLADAENAQAARQYARAAQDYTQVLTLDPKNAQARMGLARASAALGDDSYARAAGEGFAALGAGRLDEARAAFTRARSLRPNGVEALEG